METKIEKGVVTLVDYLSQVQESCYERIRCTCKQVCRKDANVSRQLAVHSPVRMRLGSVS